MRTSAPASGPSASGGQVTYRSAAPAVAAPRATSSGPSLWQSVLDELSGSKGRQVAQTFNDSYANAFRAGYFTVPEIGQATNDVERMMASAARASSVYDAAASRSFQILSRGSRPLELEGALFRLPGTPPLVGPFGERPGAGGTSLKTILLLGGAGVAAIVGIKALKKRKGP